MVWEEKKWQNFLNEILFPEHKEWIENIEYLPNELTHVDSKQKKKAQYILIYVVSVKQTKKKQ